MQTSKIRRLADSRIAYAVAGLVLLGLIAGTAGATGDVAAAYYLDGNEFSTGDVAATISGGYMAAQGVYMAGGLSATTVSGAGLALATPAGLAIGGGIVLG